MNVIQSTYKGSQWIRKPSPDPNVQWVIVFGSKAQLENASILNRLREYYPNATFTGCSTSGSIMGTAIHDDAICVTAIEFESTTINVHAGNINDFENSAALGSYLGPKVSHDKLKHVFILSDGHLVNGSALVRSICEYLPEQVFMTGGLAGDEEKFEQTKVLYNESFDEGLVVLITLHGDNLQVGKGYSGGWKPYGPYREITRADGNILYEIDHKPALEMYKSYLGNHADALPAAALRFPLGLKHPTAKELVVRTILSINDDNGSMVFAGNVPVGARCQIMHANHEGLLKAAATATKHALEEIRERKPTLGLLVSCVGRRLVLGVRTQEEIDEVENILGPTCLLTGFYSYGEVSSVICEDGRCGLQNQTMTVTLLKEY